MRQENGSKSSTNGRGIYGIEVIISRNIFPSPACDLGSTGESTASKKRGGRTYVALFARRHRHESMQRRLSGRGDFSKDETTVSGPLSKRTSDSGGVVRLGQSALCPLPQMQRIHYSVRVSSPRDIVVQCALTTSQYSAALSWGFALTCCLRCGWR